MSNMSKRMKVIFTISVLLNVILIGVIGGHALKRWSDNPLHQMQAEMSPEARHIVARTMQAAFRDGKGKMREARNVKKEIRAILAAEEFDADAFDAQAMKLHEIMSGMGQKRISITKDLAEQLSLEDRKVLAERFSRGFRGHDKGKSSKRPHAFLKDQERGNNVMPEGGPDLPKDMPPQPR